MQFLILLLAALAFFLYHTFRIMRNVELRRYLVLLLIVDIWLTIVLFYLFYSALFDY
jgi:hypothetical protein